MINIKLFFLFLISNGILFGQDISFFREDLKFTHNEDNFEIDGLYYFRNTTDKKIQQLIFYPFPDINIFGDINSIRITTKDDTTSQIATISDFGSLFRLFIDPNGEAIYHIKYKQKPESNQARYILTTAQQWGKAFEKASYVLKVPANLHIDSLSINPDTMYKSNDSTYYFWWRENFMPDVDFNLWFSEK